LEMMHDKEAEVELFRSGQQKTEAEVVALKEQAAASEAEVAALKVKMEEEGAASAVEVADLKAKLQEHWLECVATENKRKEAEDAAKQKKARAAERRVAGAKAQRGPAPPAGEAVAVRGLQYAAPYDETKITWLKERYAGIPLSQVLAEMWRLHRGEQPLEEAVAHWRAELAAGRVLYRKRKRAIDDPYQFIAPDPEALVEVGSAVQIVRHVHERVVRAVKIKVLFENESMVAIEKPAGLATIGETMGANSLMGIVRRQTGHYGAEPGHRLDKPVSGVLLLGKSR